MLQLFKSVEQSSVKLLQMHKHRRIVIRHGRARRQAWLAMLADMLVDMLAAMLADLSPASAVAPIFKRSSTAAVWPERAAQWMAAIPLLRHKP
jgi:hypothetical protein